MPPHATTTRPWGQEFADEFVLLIRARRRPGQVHVPSYRLGMPTAAPSTARSMGSGRHARPKRALGSTYGHVQSTR